MDSKSKEEERVECLRAVLMEIEARCLELEERIARLLDGKEQEGGE